LDRLEHPVAAGYNAAILPMTEEAVSVTLPPSPPDPLDSLKQTVGRIRELTGEAEGVVRRRLREEFESPGVNVTRAARDFGLTPYTWSERLQRFYGQTDAFLYQLAIWNRNRTKRHMRRWTARHLAASASNGLDVLTFGDGLGIDSVHLARAGHRVTYLEVPGHVRSFAERVFAECGRPVDVRTDFAEIPPDAFDAAVCLDVLEHVPDPPATIESLARCLRPGGRLIVHAPFYMVHPTNPTHLGSNRRFSGSLAPFKRRQLKLVDGRPGWNPIVFAKTAPGYTVRPQRRWKLVGLRLAGLYVSLGRFSAVPFLWVNAYRRRRGEWFRE